MISSWVDRVFELVLKPFCSADTTWAHCPQWRLSPATHTYDRLKRDHGLRSGRNADHAGTRPAVMPAGGRPAQKREGLEGYEARERPPHDLQKAWPLPGIGDHAGPGD